MLERDGVYCPITSLGTMYTVPLHCPITLNSLYSGYCRGLELESSSARVRNSGSLFQSNIYNFFCLRCIAAVRIIGVAVHYSGVFVRQDVVLKSGQLIANFGIVMVIR